ncbi:alpha/beta hydrolase family protein [Streptomyces sp. enrichment culture]|uniref:alpha/beta hydrolase family protein n=1 Tax=Streptomyces sp. enrichment culture TaxID=1795815 RepID=UPI003F571C9A
MRTVRATAAAVTAVIGAGAAAVAAGRLASDAALRTPAGRPLPTEPRLTVHGTAAGRVALTRHLAALRPGRYGLSGEGVHAVVGPVLDGASDTADTVVRRLEGVARGSLEPGNRVRLVPHLHLGDPGSALGLDHTDVSLAGELGPLPAWFVPGPRDTWVIAVHGLGAGREHALNLLDFLHRLGFPVLVPAYRGDRGAPRPPDGLNHLGETEWRDLDAAIRYAVDRGARQVVLHGWSTGATMALRAGARSGLRERVAGLVLDSPVLSWETTLRSLATARHTPGALLPLAVRAAQGRTGLYGDRRAGAVRLDRVTVPTVIFHGPGDTVAPWSLSRRLASAQPNTVTLRTVPDAPHGAMWNAGPAAYEESLRRFLTPFMTPFA